MSLEIAARIGAALRLAAGERPDLTPVVAQPCVALTVAVPRDDSLREVVVAD